MAKSRVKIDGGNANYEDCTFRSLLPGLPPQIVRMLRRAFESLGRDTTVLPRWSRPVRTPGGSVEERNFFPHKPGADICCADGVAFTLYQTGCFDLGMDKKAIRPIEKDYGFHLAAYWLPHGGNTDVTRCVTPIVCPVDWSDIERQKAKWLPGDYFVYWPPGKPRPAHVNIYLGPYVETTPEGDVSDVVYDVLNSSIGTAGPHAFVKASWFKSSIVGAAGGKRIFHCRLVAVEKLFKNLVGIPIELDEDPEPAAVVPEAEAAAPVAPVNRFDLPWSLVESLGSPYPVGRNLSWHGGVHLARGGKKDKVVTIGPGEIILSGKGALTTSGDSYFVLVMHRFVPEQRRILPPAPADPKDDDPAAKNAQPLYSLYMQLAPPDERYVVRPTDGGLPGLSDSAPPWLRRCWYLPRPALVRSLVPGSPITMLGLSYVAGRSAPELRRVPGAPGLTLREHHHVADLKKVTVEGTTYYLLPVDSTNADAWDDKRPPPVLCPDGSKLCFVNMLNGQLIRTGIAIGKHATPRYRMDGSRPLLESVVIAGKPVVGDEGPLIRLDGYRSPGFNMPDFHDSDDATLDQYDWRPLSGGGNRGIVVFKDGKKPIPLHVDADGEGPARELGKPTVDLRKLGAKLELRGIREETGNQKKVDRLFVELVPCVELTPSQEAAILAKLQETQWIRDARERVDAKRSTLCGVKLGEKAGWTIAEGVVTLIEREADAPPPLLYRGIGERKTKSGRVRALQEPSEGTADEDEDHVALEVDPKASGIALVPLEKPGKIDSTAVVEIVLAVDVKHEGDNKAEVDAIDSLNRKRKPAIDALLAHDVVDWRTADTITLSDRTVQREPIGTLGRVLGKAGLSPGLHVELFSGTNLMDPDVPGKSGTVEKVPKSGWLVYRDDGQENLVSPAFVQKMLAAMRAFPHEKLLDETALRKAAGVDGVLEPQEWLRFCEDRHNHRALSRLITVHPSEWKIRWSEQAKLDGLVRLLHLGKQQKDELVADEKAFHWWSPRLTLDGIQGDSVFHYHPLRFIELLATGLDLSVGFGKTDKKPEQPKIKIEVLEPGAEETPLVYDAMADVHRFRVFLGEARGDVAAKVTIENLATAIPTFRTRIVRGEINTVRLVRPRLEMSMLMDQDSVDYAVPVSQKGVDADPSDVHQLADGNRHLTGCGYSRATFLLNLYFNVKVPEKVEIEMSGDSGFSLSLGEVSGAEKTVEKADGKLTLTLRAKTRDPGSNGDEPIVASAASAQIAFSVEGRTTKIGALATLTAKASGGDLPAEQTVHGSVATREIKAGASGEDVGKMQLYLSQLLSLDDLPCFRDTGKAEANSPGADGEIVASATTGAYKPSTARALWRFIYTYGHDAGWKATSIAVTDAKGGNRTSVSLDEIRKLADRDVLRAPPPAAPTPPKKKKGSKEASPTMGDWLQQFDEPVRDALRRTAGYEATPWQCPVLDAALIAELVRCFHPPFVLPSVDLSVLETTLPATTPGPQLTVADAWNKTATGRCFVLPVAESGEKIGLRASWRYAGLEKDGDFDVILRVAETAAYRFAGGATEITSSFREMLANPRFELCWSGRMTAAKGDDNVLRIVAAKTGRTIGVKPLPGCRDLLAMRKGEPGRDAAWVAFWLSRAPDPSNPGFPFLYVAPKAPKAKKAKRLAKGEAPAPEAPPPPLTVSIDGKWSEPIHKALARFQAQCAPTASGWPSLAEALRKSALDVR